jgi:hypothetical protein
LLSAHAAAVGRFTLIKGQVDVLKGGKVPGIAAKVQDAVEPGDVIRTKSGAKAQLLWWMTPSSPWRGIPPGHRRI